jgi:hypothetical protein
MRMTRRFVFYYMNRYGNVQVNGASLQVDKNEDWPYFKENVVLAENEEAKGVILVALARGLRITINIAVLDLTEKSFVNEVHDQE